MMNRNEIYRDIKGTLGLVPKFFQAIPENSLELEWELFKATQLTESSIPNKYRELIGVGIAAATKCRYCTFFHTETAKMMGATEEEIREAIHFAKATTGWSTFLNGLAPEFSEFTKEIRQVMDYVKAQQLLEVDS
jgi:AhpD family alkylhydroperoxidase